MSLETLIAAYGYPAVAIGTFFEGETILVLAAFAAHRGYLHLPWVVIWGFVGTFCGDQLYFQIGRLQGMKFLENRPRLSRRYERVSRLLQTHQILLILGFRFLYGMRTITPFLLGASGIPTTRFLVLNTLGGFFWAIAVGVSGYLFGHLAELLIGDLRRYELIIFVGLGLVGGAIWGIRRLKRPGMPKQIAGPKN
jgi:membrane protein DedA with SNARE-associated domain